MIVHAVAAGLAFLSFASLCVFHGYLQSKGLGTYDWILRQRITPPATAQPPAAAAAAAAASASVGTGITAATRPIGGGGNSSNSNCNSNSSSSSSGGSSQPAAALPPPSTAGAGAAAAVGGEHVAINVPSPFSLTSADPLQGYSVVDKGGREEGVMIIGPDAAATAMELGGEEGGEGGQRGWGEGEEER